MALLLLVGTLACDAPAGSDPTRPVRASATPFAQRDLRVLGARIRFIDEGPPGAPDHGANMGEGVARLHALLPHSELHVFPGAGHALASEVPIELSRGIEEFLDRPAALLP